jgi:hypothetical protein
MQIVDLLQRSGSLMLDTEHLEVRVHLRDGLGKFLNALRRKADAVLFHSLGKRTNITVYYKDDDAHSFPAGLFPDGAIVSNIVKKCRIVQRDGDEFAILPLCYPSIPHRSIDWPSRPEDVRLLGASVQTSDVARFYSVALIAALWILRWVLRDLAASDPDTYTLHLPSEPDETTSEGGYTLDHLRVMHPTLNVKELTQRIAKIEREARSEGTRLRRRKPKPRPSPRFSDEELRDNAVRLLQVIRHALDDRLLVEFLEGRKKPSHPYGLPAREIFDLGRKLGWEDIRISTLFDILIDEAYLVTHVELRTDETDKQFWVRTFEPDGEMVSELVRRFTTQWALPRGF